MYKGEKKTYINLPINQKFWFNQTKTSARETEPKHYLIFWTNCIFLNPGVFPSIQFSETKQ